MGLVFHHFKTGRLLSFPLEAGGVTLSAINGFIYWKIPSGGGGGELKGEEKKGKK
jgi:hypothetical protein